MTVFERARQTWPLLVLAARGRRTYTYQELARLINVTPASALGAILEPIYRYCEEKSLPPLSILVVSEKTGKPSEGAGYPSTDDFDALREKVFACDWNEHRPNTVALEATALATV